MVTPVEEDAKLQNAEEANLAKIRKDREREDAIAKEKELLEKSRKEQSEKDLAEKSRKEDSERIAKQDEVKKYIFQLEN